MSRTFDQRFARTVLAASIASLGLPGVVQAYDDEVTRFTRPDSEIELGVGHVSKSSFKFGDYTGLNDQGAFGIANVQYIRRGETDARYLELNGSNLGLDSRSFSIEGGDQGNWGVRFSYDQLPKLHSDTYQTPYLGAGSDVLIRPTTLNRGPNPNQMVGLAAHMQSFDVKTERKAYEFGLTKHLSKQWDVVVNYKQELKEGTKLTGAIMQSTGGTRGVVIVPEPVDYKTDQFEALARYTGEKAQFQFGYYASIFGNDKNALTWDNLYNGGNFGAVGRYALPPDNQFHQINASAGYSYSPVTRLSANVSIGRMTQDDAFLPASTGAAPPALPADSLDGKVNTTHADVKFTTKLMPKLGLAAGYRYDDRDNKTPIRQFTYVTADSTAAPGLANTRMNTPLSNTKQAAYVDFDYRATANTTLKAGYDYHHVKHTFEPTKWDQEHTVKAEVRTRFGEAASGGAAYAYSERDASAYDGSAPLASTYTAAYLNSLIGGGKSYPWLEVPPLRKFFLADRKRDRVRIFTDFSPMDRLDLQLSGDYFRDRYPDSVFGLSQATGWAANFDANFAASETVNAHLFVSFDEYGTDQRGADTSGAAEVARVENNTTFDSRRWIVRVRDRTWTAGIGLKAKPSERYEFGGDYTYSYSRGDTDFAAGSGVVTAPLSDLVNRLNRVELFGRYWLQKDLSFNLKYIYAHYHSTDWAYDTLGLVSASQGGGAGNSGGLVGPNLVSPDYNVHAIGLSASYSFR